MQNAELQNRIQNIYFITGNKNKIREAEEILRVKLKNINLDLDEIQELDSDKICEHKAKEAFKKIKKPLVVWDQSLYINCLNGFPGSLIRWFWPRVTLSKICKIVNFLKNRKISTKTTLTFYNGKKIYFFYGVVYGTVPFRPRGKKGFAWDPIFIPKGYKKTFAEMSSEEKNAISMHRIALLKFKKFLNSKYKYA